MRGGFPPLPSVTRPSADPEVGDRRSCNRDESTWPEGRQVSIPASGSPGRWSPPPPRCPPPDGASCVAATRACLGLLGAPPWGAYG
eukprot:9716188-Alexandrium_andersonii.AAC.1